MAFQTKWLTVAEFRSELNCFSSWQGFPAVLLTNWMATCSAEQKVESKLVLNDFAVRYSKEIFACQIDADSALFAAAFVGSREASEFAADIFATVGAKCRLRIAVTPLDEPAKRMTEEVFWERLVECGELLDHPFNRIDLGWYDLKTLGLVPFTGRSDLFVTMQLCREYWFARKYAECGFYIFESFEFPEKRIAWASRILKTCASLLPKPIPAIVLCLEIAKQPDHWNDARKCFFELRSLTLAEREPEANVFCHVCALAELVAKIIYNESCSPMPFDRDSGWAIVPELKNLIDVTHDNFRAIAEAVLFDVA